LATEAVLLPDTSFYLDERDIFALSDNQGGINRKTGRCEKCGMANAVDEAWTVQREPAKK